MAFSKVKTESIADSGVTTAKIANDAVVASKVDDDGTGFTVGNLTSTSTVTLGSGGTNWTLPTARGTDKYVLQINGTTGASNWAESLTAPELSSHNFDVSGTTDDGGINAYEAPYIATGNTTNGSNSIASVSVTSSGDDINDLKVGQFVSGTGIPANTVIKAISGTTITLKDNTSGSDTNATATNTGTELSIQKTPGEKNGGKVILTGTNFGANIADLSVAITESGGAIIANASYLTGLSGGTSITAEWTGTEGTYSTKLKPGHADYIGDSGKIYFKVTKSGLASNVYDTNTNLTSDATLSTPSQTGGERSVAPDATTLGTYGSGIVAGGGQDSTTSLLLNFDRFGGTDIEDSSNRGGDGHKLTASGNATIKSSPFGDAKAAIYFGSGNDKLVVPASSDFDINRTSTFTIDFWFYRGTNDNYQRIISQDTGSSVNGWALTTSGVTGKFEFGVDNAGKAISVTDNPLNTWHYVRITGDGTNIRFYIDGRLDKTEGATNIGNFTQTNKGVVIGIRPDDSYDLNNGYIDELRIINGTAVSTGDSHDVPTTRFTGNETNTKLLVRSNQQITDSSSNNTVILTHGAAGIKKEETNRGSGAHANFGSSAIYMDGTGDYLSFAISSDFAAEAFGTPSGTDDDFTIEGWYRFDTVSNDIGFWGIDGASELSLYWYQPSDSLTLRTNSGNLFTATWSPSANTWYHIAFVRASTTSKVYINGSFISGATTTSALPAFTVAEIFEIGTDAYSTRELEGYVDSFRISKVARYSANFTPSTSALTSDNDTIVLIQGDGGAFADSSVGGTTHNVTPTNDVRHSSGYGSTGSGYAGGIAPAMPFSSNGKSTGSIGAYFDGGNDSAIKIDALPTNLLPELNLGNNTDFTIDFWVWMANVSSSQSLISRRHNKSSGAASAWWIEIVSGAAPVALRLRTQENATTITSSNVIYPYRWHHITLNRDVSNSNLITLYVDATSVGTYNSAAIDMEDGTVDQDQDFLLSGAYSSGNTIVDELNGYIDSFRFMKGSCLTPTANPTKIYGAFGSEKPDVGTITLVATGSGDYTWSEMSQGTALPGTLAVGSTTHSGSGDSRTHTATITGAFSSGVTSDTTTNNILLKAQNDADATKAITLGSSGGYDGISITQKSTGKPTLFNGRRYHGTTTTKSITEYGLAPDLIWAKSRTSAYHQMHDTVRGISGTGAGVIYPNSTDSAETASAIQSFDSDGFTLHASRSASINSDNGHIAWGWKAGGVSSGSALSLSGGIGAGTIANNATGVTQITNIVQSVNQNTGFSITKFRGAADGGTFPHNLGGAPSWVIIKQLTSGVGNQNWSVWHKNLSATTGKLLFLNTGAVEGSTTGYFDYSGVDMGSDTTRISIGSNDVQGGGAVDYICYAWRAISGVSAFGVYTGHQTGNPSSSDPTYCGFKPSMVILKKRDGSTGSWRIFDKFRSSGDTWTNYLKADDNGAEVTSSNVSVTAQTDGFSTGSDSAITSNNIIWMAFA